jgi:copper resistance protein D
MEAAFVLVRAVHLAALVALFGGLLFSAWVSATGEGSTTVRDSRAHRKLMRSSAGWLALGVGSGVAWLGFAAVTMSGRPLAQALDDETVRTVLGQTWFGQVWIARASLALALAAVLLAASRRRARHERTVVLIGTPLAAALLSSLALAGHANSEHGVARAIHLAVDAAHLLAAGAWLGGLLPLALVLADDRASPDSAALEHVSRVVGRFSRLGLIAVGALVTTGAVNAWFTVATIPGLLATRYGQLLLAKLAVFAGMLVLAAINRTRLTPPLVDDGLAPPGRAIALARLRRNALAELVLGMLVLGIVGVLGMTMPAAHSTATTPAMHMR